MKRITASAIKNLTVTGKRYIRRENNLEIRVGANGSIAIDFYWKDSRGTGRVPLMRLRDAQSVEKEDIEKANDQLAEYRYGHTRGVTPRAEAEANRAKARSLAARSVAERSRLPTVANLIREYKKHHLPSLKDTTAKQYAQILDDYVLPQIGPILVEEVRRGDLVSILLKESRAPTRATTRRVIGGLFTFACELEWITGSPAIKLTKVAPDPPERQRILTEKEIKQFWALANEIEKFLLATGQRVEEVARMGWDEVTEEGWLNVDPKGGRQVITPLSHLAWSLLPDRADGPVWGIHEDTLTHSVAAICKKMKPREKFTAHDLRRTAATHWTRLESGIIRERLLNHAESRLHSTYNLYEHFDEKQRAQDKWAEFILAVVKD